MQLGDCRFDRYKGVLTNELTGEEWHLPRAELQVLSLLLANNDKVVAKRVLGAGDDEHAPLSDSSVARAVFMLRSFLGPLHEHMIETVKGKGYRLRLENAVPSSVQASVSREPYGLGERIEAVLAWLFGKRHRWIKLWVGLIVLLLGVLVSLQLFSSVNFEIEHTEPYLRHSITLESGQKVMFISYAKSKTNNTSLLRLSEKMSQAFGHCESSSWKEVYMSLSHDKQVFNITMRGERMGQSLVRNLKLTDYRQQKVFISDVWFKEVSLCE
ncbi:helix-turn-helix domain-containing protein [Shewanella marisflavi]|uniref:winged helix-turn-helix domain-containing protein n=1 Tax=Shewanella marisflavi TaxID=260364 RepID=UPI00200FF5CB|nr:helix-turn-helix domain-containing protein [Shewanella marisflavi]MCL1041749.1 helix-turn-helix domain-containing protein [Shewanella marisflavi]